MKHLFPDCKIHHMPQRSPEWHEIRKDKLTASQAGAWLAERPQCRLTIPEIKDALDASGITYKGVTKRDDLLALYPGEWLKEHLAGTVDARHTAICKILGAMSNCAVPDQWEVDPNGEPPKNPALWAIWNGIRMEPEAVEAFQYWSMEEIVEVGFCEHKSGVAGCSPDGILYDQPIGFEGKAPLPATHVRYLLDGVLPDQYRSQIHFSMAVTGATAWWFQSYCPGLPPFRILTHRDDTTERMVEGLGEFAAHLESARDEIAGLWDAEFNGEGDAQ
jgi:hypothetical protein